MNKYVLSIDRGSTNIKAVVFDQDGNEIAGATVPCNNLHSKHTGFWEQDVEKIWETTVTAINQLWASGTKPNEIIGVTLTGQGNGLIGLDKNGNLVRDGIHSLDSRANEIIAEWSQDPNYGKITKKLGIPLNGGSPLPIAKWIEINEPENYQKIDKIIFSKDLIRYCLSNQICSDYTDVGGASLINLDTGQIATDIFKHFGLESLSSKIPPIKHSHEITGYVTSDAAKQTGLLQDTPIFAGAHDICAYQFGIGNFATDQLVTIIGTWGMGQVTSDTYKDSIAPIYHIVPHKYISLLGDGNSGGCLDILLENFAKFDKVSGLETEKSVYQVVEDKVLNSNPNGIIFLPFLFGNLANPDASGGLFGLKNWHVSSDIFRAIYEGIIFGHHFNNSLLPNFAELKGIWLIGGGSKSKLFGQMLADLSQKNVYVPDVEAVGARGVAMSAWVGLNYYPDFESACIATNISKTFTPNPQMYEYYEKKYEIYKNLANDINQFASDISALNHL